MTQGETAGGEIHIMDFVQESKAMLFRGHCKSCL